MADPVNITFDESAGAVNLTFTDDAGTVTIEFVEYLPPGSALAAHAATHASAGSDPVTLAESQITNLVTDLAAKVPTTRQVATTKSLTGGGDLSADRTLELVNDAASPGNTKYYGTDGAGTKGFHAIPSSGLADPGANGLLARTALNVTVARALTAGSSKVSIGNGDGVSGNPSVDVVEANFTLGNLGGTLAIAKGGTGQTTAGAAFDALSPVTTRGDLIYRDGSGNARLGISADPGAELVSDGTDPAWSDPRTGLGRMISYTHCVGAIGGDLAGGNGNGGAGASIAGSQGHPGTWYSRTGTSATNGYHYILTANSAYLFGGGTAYVFYGAVKLSHLSDATDTFVVEIGWGDNSATPPADGAYFSYSDTGATPYWTGVTANNSSRTTASGGSNVAVTTGWTHLKIVVAADASRVDFYVWDAGAWVNIGNSTTNIPTTTGRECGGRCTIRKSAGTANDCYLYYDYLGYFVK